MESYFKLYGNQNVYSTLTKNQTKLMQYFNQNLYSTLQYLYSTNQNRYSTLLSERNDRISDLKTSLQLADTVL